MKKPKIDPQKKQLDSVRFKKELQQARKVYFEEWEKEIHCPALGKNVRVTRAGWDHLVDKKTVQKVKRCFVQKT